MRDVQADQHLSCSHMVRTGIENKQKKLKEWPWIRILKKVVNSDLQIVSPCSQANHMLYIPQMWDNLSSYSKMSVRPAKTQISLGIHPVWSESLLCTQWVAKDPSFLQTESEDWSDWADAKVDLSRRWAHSHFVGFVMSWLIFSEQHNKNNKYYDWYQWLIYRIYSNKRPWGAAIQKSSEKWCSWDKIWANLPSFQCLEAILYGIWQPFSHKKW